MKKVISAAAALFAASALLVSGCGTQPAVTGNTQSTAQETQETQNAQVQEMTESNTLTALEVSKLMGNGINLGNTMEAYDHQGYLNGKDPTSSEGAWGMPHTTREMIDGMKAAGFDSLRIPVAWTNGMNFESGDYTIDARLLDRVEEIVGYALDADMYVIVNDHWDGSWWGMFGSASEETRAKAMDMYKAMWTQIAERFRDHSYKLIFESANEELGDRLNDKDIASDSGTLSENECYEMTYRINSEFVKLVRESGGKNADRFLLIAGYNTDITRTCDERFRMPDDTADGKLFLSVHYYTPWDYCGIKALDHWGSPRQYDEQNRLLKMLTKFTDQGYGIIIGEYAVLMNGMSPKPDTDIFYTNFLNNCDLYNYVPMLWDCNNLYRRNECRIANEELAKLFLDRSLTAQSSLTEEQIADNARKEMEEAIEAAEEKMTDEGDIPASDDTAVAWIMYQSGDYTAAYCVGDLYDPTNKTYGIKAQNALITGEGTYTVSLDLKDIGNPKGVAFAALGISNGETLFPGYAITIDSFRVNGEEKEIGKGYTSSDDDKCTRMNLYNGWVHKVPDNARTADGSLEDVSAQIWEAGKNERIMSIEISFTFSKAPAVEE